MLDALAHALPVALSWSSILAMIAGTAAGILVGALPGLTAAMAIALLLPLTFTMEPLTALGMIAGVYNGAMYGGAIPAVLLRMPGTPAAIATTFDGYPMARDGRAGDALRIAAVSSSVGGMASAIALFLFAPPLSMLALSFGPPEMFWVGVFGLTSIALLLGGDPGKGVLSAGLGLLLATVGVDPMTGHERFTFGQVHLVSGLNIAVVLIGLYALPPAFAMAETTARDSLRGLAQRLQAQIGVLETARRFAGVWLRSSIIGIVVGVLPGVGGNIAALLAYNETKRASREPDTFGRGNPSGVAAAECGNNADNAASMIPALTLGVPGSIVAALVLGGLLVHGLQPGPQLFRDNPDVVYGFMIELFITAALLIPFGGFVATRLFAQALRVPPALLLPLVVALTVLGVYAINNSTFDVMMLLLFGLAGYALERLDVPLAPATLAFILGPMVEANLRISLLLGRGDPLILVTRPIALAVLALTLAVVAYALIPRRRRPEAGARAASDRSTPS